MFTDYFGFLSLLLSTIGVLLTYHYVIRTWNYFSKNNVKFVRGLPFVGSHYKTFLGTTPLLNSLQSIYNRFPKERLVGYYEIGGRPAYLIRDPELVKQIAIKDFDHFVNHAIQADSDPVFSRALFTMKDQKWRDMRSTLSPAFTGSKMRTMNALLVEVARIFCKELKNEIGGQTKVYDMKELFGRVANDVIASTAFGINVNSMKERNNQFYKTGFKISDIGTKFALFLLAPKLMKLLGIKIFDESSISYFRDMISENMKYRQDNNIVRPDMINILLEVKKGMLSSDPDSAEPEEDTGFATVAEERVLNVKYQDFDDDDLMAQCLAFFLGGFSSISITMCFFAHELAVNKHVQEKLYEEVKEVKDMLQDAPLDYDTLKKMKYLDMTMSEVLRRWIGFANDRAVNKPYTIENPDGSKVQLNVGDTVWLPAYPLHMDPQYHPNPETFYPERFSDENKNNIIPGTYLPFGIGPRSCIANRFALMECKALMYHLLSEFHLEKCEKTMDPIIVKKTLQEPRDGFWLQIRPRK